MDASAKEVAVKVLSLAACSAAGFGTAIRLLRDDPEPPGPAGGALLACALLAAGLLAVAAAVRGQAALRAPLVGLLAVLVPTLGLLSVLLAPGPAAPGLGVLASLAGAFLFFPAALQAGRDGEWTKNLLKAALGIAAVQALIGVAQFFGGDGGGVRGTLGSPTHAAGVLAMALPAAAGLLLNSIHETLDPSVWPRRALYALLLLVFVAGLFTAGSETAWLSLAVGALVFLGMAGGTYLQRNVRVLAAVLAAAAAAATGAVVLQAQPDQRLPGYGTLRARADLAGRSAREDARAVARSPLLGDGFAGESRRAAEPARARGEAAVSSPLRLAASGGVPLLAALLLLLALSFSAAIRGFRPGGDGEEGEHVVVGRRRPVKAIEVASAAAAGGAAAFLFAGAEASGLGRAVFLAALLPLWLTVQATAYSYKHFRLVGENRRDFVAIGAAAGAAAGLVRSLAGDDLLHAPTLFFLLLLLAVAVARSSPEEADWPIDLRRPKALRPAAAILGVLLCAAGAWVLAQGL
ncbi:MAG: hypothetical protein MUC63_00235 [Planctomycetes bacterium]|nr:hypothetical protein [Planctomycetota bacterium]